MPTYEYKCENGHVFEAFQKMSDDPLTECEECGAPVQRVSHPVAVHFKGKGFYTTDYGAQAKAGGSSDGEGKSESSSSSDSSDSSSTDSKEKDSSEKKTAKAESD